MLFELESDLIEVLMKMLECMHAMNALDFELLIISECQMKL